MEFSAQDEFCISAYHLLDRISSFQPQNTSSSVMTSDDDCLVVKITGNMLMNIPYNGKFVV